MWIAHGMIPGFSLWSRVEQATTTLYLSPVAAELGAMLILRFGGSPCPEPELNEATFIFGDAVDDDPPLPH